MIYNVFGWILMLNYSLCCILLLQIHTFGRLPLTCCFFLTTLVIKAALAGHVVTWSASPLEMKGTVTKAHNRSRKYIITSKSWASSSRQRLRKYNEHSFSLTKGGSRVIKGSATQVLSVNQTSALELALTQFGNRLANPHRCFHLLYWIRSPNSFN